MPSHEKRWEKKLQENTKTFSVWQANFLSSIYITALFTKIERDVFDLPNIENIDCIIHIERKYLAVLVLLSLAVL